jgi:hypothetical protein
MTNRIGTVVADYRQGSESAGDALHGLGIGLRTCQRRMSRTLQALRHAVRQAVGRLVEGPTDPGGEEMFVHNVIPLAFKAAAKVCVAREQ